MLVVKFINAFTGGANLMIGLLRHDPFSLAIGAICTAVAIICLVVETVQKGGRA